VSPPPVDVLVLHGPNLNLLGLREPEVYGTATLAEIDEQLAEEAERLGLSIETQQSNHEGAIVDAIQSAIDRARCVVLNAAGYTHTSVAIRDAVAAIAPLVPVVEVHLSVPDGREAFRRHNLLSGVVSGRIEGFGPVSYVLALGAASALIRARGVVRDQ
jgi:3-dehydroquinate dehydratase-2